MSFRNCFFCSVLVSAKLKSKLNCNLFAVYLRAFEDLREVLSIFSWILIFSLVLVHISLKKHLKIISIIFHLPNNPANAPLTRKEKVTQRFYFQYK